QIARSRRSGKAFLWLLVILAAAGLIWLWWAAAKKPKPTKAPTAPPPPVAVTPPPSAAPRAKTNAPLISTVAGYPRPVQTIFEAQLALDRQGISSGSLDGKIGSQ